MKENLIKHIINKFKTGFVSKFKIGVILKYKT